ncbi:MAG: ammonium transporter [Gammaproteobacteria bacterium]|nr:MAG: ammonium transporter [Gammaproteobacteria bacterium]
MKRSIVGLVALVLSAPVLAADEVNAGDTAWMLTATALVLFMTIPGLALFYAGMVRSKNVLSVLMQCFAITCLVTVIWVLWGYSIAFGGEGALWGGLSKAFLAGVGVDAVHGTIPETVFVTFQMTFAIITPALIVGAFVDRMKFSALLVFIALWVTLVYAPIAHWVWGDGGWLLERGVLDFAGGTVVHINAGIAGLVTALVLGKRQGFPGTAMPPHNLPLSVIGASMLWVGWFGFNAGSQLAADGVAGMAMLVTQVATACAALGWMIAEWITHKKASVLGMITGAVAGLVAITPASGAVGPMGALAIGLSAGVICFFASTTLKRALGYDDSLDVFGVHCIGGIVGAMLTGVFCAKALGGAGFGVDIVTMGGQLLAQATGVLATLTYTAIATFIILKGVDMVVGLRVSEEDEAAGLDVALHNETGYNL